MAIFITCKRFTRRHCISNFGYSSFTLLRNLCVGEQNYMDVKLSATPQVTLIDERVNIQVTGLDPGAKIAIKASLQEGNARFSSTAHFTADKNGCVDLEDQESLGGSYRGLDEMGLFTRMSPDPGQRSGLRLFKKDVGTPYNIRLAIHTMKPSTPTKEGDPEQHWLYEKCIAETTIQRTYMADGVTMTPVREGRIRGSLFLPKGTAPHQGLIDMYGTAGGLIQHRAALLASRGFAVLALAYFDYEDLPDTMFEIDLEYFGEAVDWLSSHPRVIPGGVGVIGLSKGGEMAMLMAMYFPKVVATVIVSSVHYVQFSTINIKEGVIQGAFPVPSKIKRTEEGFRFDDAYDENINETNIIKVENIKCPMLFLFGGDDAMVSPASAKFIDDRLKQCNKSNYEIITYPGAGHLLEPPYAPFGRASFHIVFRDSMVWGGEAEAHCRAEVDAWSRILKFFRNNLPSITSQTVSKL